MWRERVRERVVEMELEGIKGRLLLAWDLLEGLVGVSEVNGLVRAAAGEVAEAWNCVDKVWAEIMERQGRLPL